MEIRDVWAVAREIGPGGVVILMYICWRQQRKLDKLEDTMTRLIVASTRALNQATESVRSQRLTFDKLTEAFYSLRNRLAVSRRKQR